MKKKDEMIHALCDELQLRKSEIDKNDPVKTIYFGGGTPTIITVEEIQYLLDIIYKNYSVIETPEITIEANPDDLTPQQIALLSQSKVNRLSIGIQSFYEQDLKLMNRAHNHIEAKECLTVANRYFDNISVDLIYGIPKMPIDRWKKNIQTVLDYNIPHISCYALTVEPKTALEKLITKGTIAPVSDHLAKEHFDILIDILENNGYIHYEISNFAKPGFFSKNNTAYWEGKKYLGIGPSAHSYNGKQRSWNIDNNTKYIKAIDSNKIPQEIEELSIIDIYNEYVMTGLRTMWGVSIHKIDKKFGKSYKEYLVKQAQKHIAEGTLSLEKEILKTTRKGKFLCDGIASDLFLLNLE